MLRRLLDLFSFAKLPEFSMPDGDSAHETKSGLRYQVIRKGDPEGKRPRVFDRVTVRYVGWTEDGVVFDKSYPRPVTFAMDRVIKGWSQALQLMREGDVYRFAIPPELAYGKRGVPPRIGPDATLVFHVELIRVSDDYGD